MSTSSLGTGLTRERHWRERVLLKCREMAEKYALRCLGSIVFVAISLILWLVPILGLIVILCLIVVIEYVVSSRCSIYRGWFFPEDIDY